MNRYLFVFLLIAVNFNLHTQTTNLLAGPMTSFVDSYGTQIWFLLTNDVKKIEIDISDYENDRLKEYSFDVINEYQFDKFIPYTVNIDNLLPNKEYIAKVFLDGEYQCEFDIFTKRPHLDDLQFLIGQNVDGATSNLLKNMSESKSDFMVSLGGHIKNNEDLSFDKLVQKYVDRRLDRELNNFLVSMPQIATWSIDECYSCQNNFSNKIDYEAFKLFWPNFVKKAYNYTFNNYGTYQRYTYNDLDLFLLDSETFKSNDCLYCDNQIDRIFKEINNTNATFTVIASPVSFLDENGQFFRDYKKEYIYFMERLSQVNKKGVILISGSSKSDVLGLSKTMFNESGLTYNNNHVFEFSTPSLSSNVYTEISINGELNQRILRIKSLDDSGVVHFDRKFRVSDLN